jgi:hypothetical protein
MTAVRASCSLSRERSSGVPIRTFTTTSRKPGIVAWTSGAIVVAPRRSAQRTIESRFARGECTPLTNAGTTFAVPAASTPVPLPHEPSGSTSSSKRASGSIAPAP